MDLSECPKLLHHCPQCSAAWTAHAVPGEPTDGRGRVLAFCPTCVRKSERAQRLGRKKVPPQHVPPLVIEPGWIKGRVEKPIPEVAPAAAEQPALEETPAEPKPTRKRARRDASAGE